MAGGAITALAGCFFSGSEAIEASPDEINAAEDLSAVLKSTLVLDNGCIATKVGPRQLLMSARCVAKNATLEVGKTIQFSTAAPVGSSDAGAADAAAARGAGARDAGAKDSGADATVQFQAPAEEPAPAPAVNARQAVIAEVHVHPSFEAKCKDGKDPRCAFGTVEASDSPDVALLVLTEDLETVPTVPVDLDAVGEADPLLVVNSGCDRLDGRRTGRLVATRTMAVPAKSVNHTGSEYKASPQFVSRLASSYVVVPAAAWRATEARFCKVDVGAPAFRAGAVAVTGIFSSYTTFRPESSAAVTAEHTRVDSASRFKIGDWLADKGVLTIHTCSEAPGGCKTRTYDGGVPVLSDSTTADLDGGAGDAQRPDAGPGPGDVGQGQREDLPAEEEPYLGPDDDYADAAVARKKKVTRSACSASPGTAASAGPFGGALLGLGLVLAARRRKRS